MAPSSAAKGTPPCWMAQATGPSIMAVSTVAGELAVSRPAASLALMPHAAVIRCLVSTQAWLRMHEEFGVPGTESGPVVAWGHRVFPPTSCPSDVATHRIVTRMRPGRVRRSVRLRR